MMSHDSVVNVKQFGAEGDGSTDDRAAIQKAIDTIGTEGCLYFPPGVYRVVTTTETGNDVIQSETGSTTDAPDFVILKLIRKKNFLIFGNGATIQNDRGYVFFGLLCENVSIQGLRIENIVNPVDTTFTLPTPAELWQPSAIHMNYSAWCKVENCFISGQYRAIHFGRTTGCTIRGNSIFYNVYIAIATYGTLFQPSGWSTTNLLDFFSNPRAHLDDSGILVRENLISNFAGAGIYTDGPGSVLGNRIEHPVDPTQLASSSIEGSGIIIAAGQTLVVQNRIYVENYASFRSDADRFIGIRVHLEDVNRNRARVRKVQILSNTIEGGGYGMRLAECEDIIAKSNDIRGYTGAAIHLFTASSNLFSLVQNVHITENFVGAVDSESIVKGESARAPVGGIVLSREGSNAQANHIYVRNNIFNRKHHEIVDLETRERHQHEIDLSLESGSFSAALPNDFGDSLGQIRTVNNSIAAGRNVDGYTLLVTEDTEVPNLPGFKEILLHVNGSTSDLTITLPQHMTLGQKITIVNSDNFSVIAKKFGNGYTINGTNAIQLDNGSATVANKAHSAITLVCASDSITSDAYAMVLIHATELYGGTVQLVD